MNKKRIILGLLMAVMATLMCGFWHEKTPTVFAAEVESANDEAGTYTGKGFYVHGAKVTLSAQMNNGYQFDAWEITSGTGADAKTEYKYEINTSFTAEENIVVKPKWHKIAYAVSVDGLYMLNAYEMDYFLQYGDDLGVDSKAFCLETKESVYEQGNIYKLEKNAAGKYVWTLTTDTIDGTLLAKFDVNVSVITPGAIHTSEEDDDDKLKFYSDALTLNVKPKDGVYVYDVNPSNININGTSVEQIRANSANPMGLNFGVDNKDIKNYDNSEKRGKGFKEFTLNVTSLQQKINLTANITYMYTITLESCEGAVAFDNIKNLVGVEGYYSVIEEENNKYLVKDRITINFYEDSNGVYKFKESVFNNEAEGNASRVLFSRSLTLIQHSTLKVNYSKIGYNIGFSTYILENGNNYVMQSPLYNISTNQLTVGDIIVFEYNDSDKSITVGGTKYDFQADTYGYKFVGFALNNAPIAAGADGKYSYTLTEAKPDGVQIQIILEYIKYSFEIKLVDSYFDATERSYSIDTSKLVAGNNIILGSGQIVTGSIIELSAYTNKFQLVGWSLKSNPSINTDYLKKSNNGDKLDYKYEFIATTDTVKSITEPDHECDLTIYLDVTYKYLSVEYNLASDNITSTTIKNEVKQLDFDIVKHDINNKILTFINSEDETSGENIEYTEITEDLLNGTQTISTDMFGDVIITENGETTTLTYGDHGLVSKEAVMEGDVFVYEFAKAITEVEETVYYGSMQIGVIESITYTLDIGGTSANITFSGTLYNDDGTGASIEIAAAENVVTTEEDGYYLSSVYGYDLKAYIHAATPYIIFNDVKFVLDGATDEYKLIYSARDRESIRTRVIKNAAEYTIQLNKLLENHIVVYQTKTTNSEFYQFSSFKDNSMSSLWQFDLNGFATSFVPAISKSNVTAIYNKSSLSIYLEINKGLAYSDSEGNLYQIKYSVDTNECVGDDNGLQISREISAIAGQTITISVEADKIAKGYRFVRFEFDGVKYSEISSEEGEYKLLFDDSTKEYKFFFEMNESHFNKTFNIVFEVIEYTLNVAYIDKDGNETSNHGVLQLMGKDNLYSDFTTGIFTIENSYNFRAMADEGCYVLLAYTGTQTYIITDLAGANHKTNRDTYWSIAANSNVFRDAICAVGDANGNVVNLKVCFTLHTYTITVKYKELQNLDVYPNIDMNGNIVTVNEKKVEATGFEYGTDVVLELTKFRKGTTLEKWVDGTTANKYIIKQINKDIELEVELKYIPYTFDFKAIEYNSDPINENNDRGAGVTGIKAYELFNTVTYTITEKDGYELKRMYYYTGDNSKVVLESNDLPAYAGGYTTRKRNGTFNYFKPENFKVNDDNSITIYLEFDLRTITITLDNKRKDEGEINSLGMDVNEWLKYTVSRTRGEETVQPGEYVFRTGDILTIDIQPKSVGIILSEVKLGGITIGFSSTGYCKLERYKIEEDDGTLLGIGYTVTVKLADTIICDLPKETDFISYLQIRKYNINYTYNLIDFEFGVFLTLGVNAKDFKDPYFSIDINSSAEEPDFELQKEGIPFNSVVTFTYDKPESGTDNVASKFDIKGVSVNLKDYKVENGTFIINDKNWTEIALPMLDSGNININVMLKLTPKITLQNYVEGSKYTYKGTYNATEQGLVVDQELPEEKRDIVIIKGFDLSVTYYYYNDDKGECGELIDTDKPINVGTYWVNITASISANNTSLNISLESQNITIIYIIEPAQITLGIKSVLEKVYDGNTAVDKNQLITQLEFKVLKLGYNEGLFGDDVLTLDIDKLQAIYADYKVTEKTIAIHMTGISLVGVGATLEQNYQLSVEDNLTIDNAGKINHRELIIRGYTALNKVYDGENTVNVNTTGIIYQNKIAEDSAELNIEALKFYLEDYSVGFAREVKVDTSEALIGADRANYKIKYQQVYIDIHPQELTQTVAGHGVFKIVDTEKKCLIPIGAKIMVKVYENGSEDFQHMYSKVQVEMGKNEKLKYCYKVALVLNNVEDMMDSGLTIYLPEASKATQVHQLSSDNENVQSVDFVSTSEYIAIKAVDGRCIFGIVVDTTFLPLWAIILIVAGSLLVVGTFVAIFIIIRAKAKRKYGTYDRI